MFLVSFSLRSEVLSAFQIKCYFMAKHITIKRQKSFKLLSGQHFYSSTSLHSKYLFKINIIFHASLLYQYYDIPSKILLNLANICCESLMNNNSHANVFFYGGFAYQPPLMSSMKACVLWNKRNHYFLSF